MESNSNLIQANAIGNDLARQYYRILTDDPTSLHLFYNNDYIRSFPDLDKRREIIYKNSEIHQKVISKGHRQNSTTILSTVCHTTFQNSIVVQIFGKICHGGPGRRFMQTFIIVPENRKYFVNIDTFCYVDEMISLETMWSTENVDEKCMTVVHRAQTPSVPNTPPPAKETAELVPTPSTKSPEVPKPKKKTKPRKKPVESQPPAPALVSKTAESAPLDVKVEQPTSTPVDVKVEQSTPNCPVSKLEKKTPASKELKKEEKPEVSSTAVPKTWAGLMVNCKAFNMEPPKKEIEESVPEKKAVINGKAKPANNGKQRPAHNGTAGPASSGRPRSAGNGTSVPATNGLPRPAGNRAFGNSTRGKPRPAANGTQGPSINGKPRPSANSRHWSSQGKNRPVPAGTQQSANGPKKSATTKPQVNGTEQ